VQNIKVIFANSFSLIRNNFQVEMSSGMGH